MKPTIVNQLFCGIGILMLNSSLTTLGQEGPPSIATKSATPSDNQEPPAKRRKIIKPDLTFHAYIGTLPYTIQLLKEIHSSPVKLPPLIELPRKMIIHGYAGVGKTVLIESIAKELNAQLLPINDSEFIEKLSKEQTYYNNHVNIVSYLKNYFHKLFQQNIKQSGPILILWMIGLEAITKKIDNHSYLAQAVDEIITEMSKQQKKVLFIGEQEKEPNTYLKSTFSTIHIGLPKYKERISLLKTFTKDILPSINNIDEIQWDNAVKKSEDLTGYEIKRVIHIAVAKVILSRQETIPKFQDNLIEALEAYRKERFGDEALNDSLKDHNEKLVL